MNESDDDTMNKETTTIDNRPPQHGPDYMKPSSVRFNPDNAQPIAGLLNKIVAYEVGQGVRSENVDRDTEDILDKWQRDFMVASQGKAPTIFEISQSRIDYIRDHFDKYAVGKDLSDEARLEGKKVLQILKVSLGGSRSGVTEAREPSQFGVGADSVIDPWLKGRAGKNKFD